LLAGFQLVKQLPAFYGTRRFITAVTNASDFILHSKIIIIIILITIIMTTFFHDLLRKPKARRNSEKKSRDMYLKVKPVCYSICVPHLLENFLVCSKRKNTAVRHKNEPALTGER
jgi:hypothetical protein